MKNYKLTEVLKQGFSISQLKITVVALLLSFSSCDKFLDVEPKGTIDAGKFYANPGELVFALNGVYQQQRVVYGDFSFYNIVESRSDNTKQDQTDQKERVETDTFEETPGNLLLVGVWTNIYSVINNANTVIARSVSVPANTPDEKTLVARTVAEAKFIRAMSYFDLANLFGGVPLRTEPTTDFSKTIVARGSLDATYDLIIKDLTEASTVLPDSYDGSLYSEKGRATRFAALTLLGKVQLQKGNPTAASTALQSVIGKYSLLPNYSAIHAAGNNNSAESIFEISFNPTNSTGLTFNNALIPASEAQRLGIVAGGSGGKLHTFPTVDVTKIYEAGDLRSAASFTAYSGGNSPYYISKYIDVKAAGDGSDINLVVLRYADALLMKAEADGESAASYELINQVRRRAFGKSPSSPDPTIDISAATPGTFIDKVMYERRCELIFEGHRWLDLKRMPQDKALKIINDNMAAEYTGVPTVVATRFIYPIPQQEILVSEGVVTQNPGYPN